MSDTSSTDNCGKLVWTQIISRDKRIAELKAEVDRLTKRCEQAREWFEEHSHSWDCCRCIVCGHFEAGYYDDERHHSQCPLAKWLEGKP